MPKLNMSHSAATKGGSGLNAIEGFWEIGKAYSTPFQFPANAEMQAKKEEYPWSTMVILELFKLDPKTHERVDDEPIVEKLSFGRQNGMDKVRPGKMDSPEDDDAKDLGSDPGTEGNSVYCEEGVTLPDNCGWVIFEKDLTEKGFKAEYSGSGWLPYLEGTKFEVIRHPGYQKPGKDYKGYPPTNLGVKSIVVRGYEVKKGKGTSAAGKGKATATSAPATAATSASKANGHATVNDEQAAIITNAVVEFGSGNAGKEGIKRSSLQASVMSYLLKNTKTSMKEKNDLMNATVKDDGWLLELSAGVGFVFDPAADGGKGLLSFPE